MATFLEGPQSSCPPLCPQDCPHCYSCPPSHIWAGLGRWVRVTRARDLGNHMASPLSLGTVCAPPTLPPRSPNSEPHACWPARCPMQGRGQQLPQNRVSFLSLPQVNLSHRCFTRTCTLRAQCACPSSRRTRTGGQPSQLSRYEMQGASLSLSVGPEDGGLALKPGPVFSESLVL